MIQKPKGTRDFLPKESKKIRQTEQVFLKIAEQCGFKEMRFPMFEKTELFERGVGETTDVVRKEMFRVISAANLEKYKEGQYDLKKEGMTLRPEQTASIIRSFIENKMYADAQPTKVFSVGSNFRNERPQAGRFREFTQFDVEVFGSLEAFTDAEVIQVGWELIQQLGITQSTLYINSIGCPQCRPAFHQALKDFAKPKLEHMCPDCQDRYEKNPLRLLDCKVPEDQAAMQGHPQSIDYLCPACEQHFEQVKQALEIMEIPYTIDGQLVRGLDYYVRTVFEYKYEGLGSQNALGGGGRYDGLIASLGGPDLPGIGFGMGMDRLIIAQDLQTKQSEQTARSGIYLVPLGDEAKPQAIRVLDRLRKQGLVVEMEVMNRSMKSAFKYADKMNYRYIIIIGESELQSGSALLKDLQDSTQEQVAFNALEDYTWNR